MYSGSHCNNYEVQLHCSFVLFQVITGINNQQLLPDLAASSLEDESYERSIYDDMSSLSTQKTTRYACTMYMVIVYMINTFYIENLRCHLMMISF